MEWGNLQQPAYAQARILWLPRGESLVPGAGVALCSTLGAPTCIPGSQCYQPCQPQNFS